jgi:Holliday junction resolvasome RuvABC endonuclease subunit
MRVQGYDPSSSLSGVCNVVDGAPVEVDLWRPPKKSSKDDCLLSHFAWVGRQMDLFKPDLVGFEQVMSTRNMRTVRILAYWEASIVIQARKRRIIVQPVAVKQARDIVMGDGRMEKEEVLRQLRVRYPDLGWRASNVGGLDQADSAVVALATPDLLERR